jgi:hypothetical protein
MADTYVTRQGSNPKDKVELCNRLLANHGVGTADVLFVQREESGAVENGKQGSPLLEEDVDHLIRHQTRRCLERDDALWASGCFDAACAKEGVTVDIGR